MLYFLMEHGNFNFQVINEAQENVSLIFSWFPLFYLMNFKWDWEANFHPPPPLYLPRWNKVLTNISVQIGNGEQRHATPPKLLWVELELLRTASHLRHNHLHLVSVWNGLKQTNIQADIWVRAVRIMTKMTSLDYGIMLNLNMRKIVEHSENVWIPDIGIKSITFWTLSKTL